MAKIIRENLNERFSKYTTMSIASNILILLVGIVMLLKPGFTNKVIGYITGSLFLIVGISAIIKYFGRDGAKLYSLNLFFGIIISIVGILTILSPTSVTSFLTVCLGIYIIMIGANKTSYGHWLKVGNDSSWIITLFIGIMEVLIGIIVMFNPFASLTVTQVVGTFLILSAILEITDTILLRRRHDEITKIFW